LHRYRNKFTCNNFDFGCGTAVATALALKAIAIILKAIATIIISSATGVIAIKKPKNNNILRLL